MNGKVVISDPTKISAIDLNWIDLSEYSLRDSMLFKKIVPDEPDFKLLSKFFEEKKRESYFYNVITVKLSHLANNQKILDLLFSNREEWFPSLTTIKCEDFTLSDKEFEKIFEHFSTYKYFIRDTLKVSAKLDKPCIYIDVNCRSSVSGPYRMQYTSDSKACMYRSNETSSKNIPLVVGGWS